MLAPLFVVLTIFDIFCGRAELTCVVSNKHVLSYVVFDVSFDQKIDKFWK